MSEYQPHANRPTAAEALLRECQPADAAEQRALRELLTAASSPARAGELAGETAALVAFRSALTTSTRNDRSQPAMKRTLATVFSVKAAAVAVALTGMGGVALAAGTGTLPGPLADSSDSAEHKDGNAFGHEADKDAAKAAFHAEKDAAKAAKDAAKDAARASRASEKATAKAIASFSGLCNAFEAGALDNPGKSEHSTAFGRLIAAAGGIESVPFFCENLAAAAELEKDAAKDGKTKPSKADKTHGKAGLEHGKAGEDHAKAGENGKGAERSKAGEDHKKAGVDKSAKVKSAKDKPAKSADDVEPALSA